MTQEPSGVTQTGRYYYGTGRRKEAVARVRIYSGSGTIEVNGRPYLDVFSRVLHQEKARQPLQVAEAADKCNVVARILGGGASAWADALTHGTARALVASDEGLRPAMRKNVCVIVRREHRIHRNRYHARIQRSEKRDRPIVRIQHQQ